MTQISARERAFTGATARAGCRLTRLVVTVLVVAGVSGCMRPPKPDYRQAGPKQSSSEMGSCVAKNLGTKLKAANISAIEVVRQSRWISPSLADRVNKLAFGYWQELIMYEVSVAGPGSKEAVITLDYAPPGIFGWKIQSEGSAIIATVPEETVNELHQSLVCDAMLEFVAQPVLNRIEANHAQATPPA